MTFFFGDGFDLYTAITDCGTYWDASFGATASLAISASGRFAGSRGLTNPVASANPYITKTSGVNDAVHHFSVAIQIGTISGSNIGTYIGLYDGATAQCTVGFRNDGAIVLISGGVAGTVLATYTGALAAPATWYQFEIEVVVNSTTGSIAVRKLGATSNDFFLGSLNTRSSANNYANKIGVGSNNTLVVHTVDDFLWRSDASFLPWLGDIRCYTRMPASDASVQWTPSGSAAQSPYPSTGTSNISGASSIYVGFVPTTTGTLNSVSINVTTAATASIKCTLFAANAAGNGPGVILASATIVTNPGVGAVTFTFSSPPSLSQGTLYFIGFMASASSGVWSTCASGNFYLVQTTTITYASFPVANPGTLIQGNGVFVTLNTTQAAPTVNSPLVAEAQQDGAATYVLSSTVGQSDLYRLASISATPGSIVGVVTRAYMQKSDAGTRIAAVQLQSGASNVQTPLTLNTTFGWAYRNDLVDPATGAAWTATGVNNATIGVTVTT